MFRDSEIHLFIPEPSSFGVIKKSELKSANSKGQVFV
jgi:hypothetical protein